MEDLFDPESLTLCIPVPNARNHVGATVGVCVQIVLHLAFRGGVIVVGGKRVVSEARD